jgi:hypothetical protein
MRDMSKARRDAALVTIALDHVWRWYEFRTTSGLQVLNYFLLASAVMSTAYVSAINGRLYAVAGAIAILGVAVSGAAYLVGKRQRDVARLAETPLKEIEGWLAADLGIDSLRMAARAEEGRKTWWRSATVTANIVFPLAAAVSAAAAAYAWFIR